MLGRAREVLAADPRVVAAWVEGSHAGGTADPWSDIDLHVAVPDPSAVDGEELLGRVAPVISSLSFQLGPVGLVAATVEGPVRVDPARRGGGAPRPRAGDRHAALGAPGGVRAARRGVAAASEAVARAYLREELGLGL